MQLLDKFFKYAVERQSILLSKKAKISRDVWTKDPTLKEWAFCNIFREDDFTTKWFKHNVRNALDQDPKILFATVAFRWFNRVETGEKIVDLLVGEWDVEEARRRLKDTKPVVTGSYIIKTPNGMNKLDGVLQCIENVRPHAHRMAVDLALDKNAKLEDTWTALKQFGFLGDFMAYEIVTDLRHTHLLDTAPDIMTWANPGPGACRGCARVVGLEPGRFKRNNRIHYLRVLAIMKELLEASKNPDNWPSDWQKWEMRDVEHTLCEFDKYRRVIEGGRMKNKYKPRNP